MCALDADPPPLPPAGSAAADAVAAVAAAARAAGRRWPAVAGIVSPGVLASSIRLPGVKDVIEYGPVPGMGFVPTSCGGVVEGTIWAPAPVSWKRKSGSGCVRWNATVRAASSGTMPADRSHEAG